MAVNREHTDERMLEFQQACERQGLKLTHQRMEIYRVLAGSDAHPDAETIYQRVRKRVPTISRDTVYRNLNGLAELGLISVVGMSHERIRFDANMGQHHHFVCVKCGLIRDFEAPALAALSIPREAAAYGEPVSMHLEVKGVCSACRGSAKGRR